MKEDTDSITRNTISPRERLLVISVILVGAILRIYFALNKNIIFIDEGSIIDRISKDLIGNIKTLKHNENIYPQILWLLLHSVDVDFVVSNPFIIRTPSILIFSISLYFLYRITRRFFDLSVSFGALILSVSSFFLIDTSFEPRGYILGGLFVFLAAYFSSRFYLSFISFILASACHISSFFYLPFVLYILFDRYGKIDKRIIISALVSISFILLMQTFYLFFGEKYYSKLIPQSKGDIMSALLSSIYTFSGDKNFAVVLILFFIIGILHAEIRKKLFIIFGISGYFFIIFSELLNPKFAYFLVKHTFISAIFFYIGSLYGISTVSRLFLNIKPLGFLVFSFLIMTFGLVNLSNKFLWSKYGLSSPFSPENLIKRAEKKLKDGIVYFDPMFMTRGVGTLFFQWHVKNLDVKFFIDKNFSYFLKFNGENVHLKRQWTYEHDLKRYRNHLRFFVFFPAVLPDFYDELNSVEWWKGDYEENFYATANTLKNYAKQNYGIDLEYSLGVFLFELYINPENLITEIEILRDIVSDLFIRFVSFSHRSSNSEISSSQ